MTEVTVQTGDGVVSRDPDVIQREIEDTRANLTRTLDAIVDQASPKRVATRSVTRVKERISAWFGHDYRYDVGGASADPAVSGGPTTSGASGGSGGSGASGAFAVSGSPAASGSLERGRGPDPALLRGDGVVSSREALASGVPPGYPYQAGDGTIRRAETPRTRLVLRTGRVVAAVGVVAAVAGWIIYRRTR